MIEFLQGNLVGKQPDAAVMEVGGVGYLVRIPLSTYEDLPAEGKKARVLTHMHVREDEISLYGFATQPERELFRMLLGVSQVGPAVALRALGSCSPAQFKRFILDEDVESLRTLVKGIGPKTARRLIVELKGAIEELAVEAARTVRSRAASDAIQALVQLGETRAAAEKAVMAALERTGEDVDEQRLVQEALAQR